MRDQPPLPRMARDLIGPALPPGFKALGTADDKERDPSPGKLPHAPCLPGPPSPFSCPASLSKACEDGGVESGRRQHKLTFLPKA